jgi:DNA-binding LytR/AlgR family response regulator
VILDYDKQSGKKILITEKMKSFYINLEDITYISCDKTVSTVHVVNRKDGYSMARLLKSIENELVEYGFMRVKHHILVNTKYLTEMQIIDGKQHITINNTDIVVSRRKVSSLKGH